ncbi:hypothetical protein NE237_018812 [Protea cynaroides]|uniref:Uncharacterized protein n=1 Tax=Protea cynaroides TaxID=273540 RepID=A0A9Q0KAK5_9MAGN|nr:hypothetical protein NE237_018812 [Protea cynaroides]
MSVASSSIPCIKISSSSSATTTCCSSSSSSSSFKFSATKPSITIRNSNAEGPIRRPVAPPLRQPSAPIIPVPPSPSSSPSPLSTPLKPVSVAGVTQVSDPNVITSEFQRTMAKELQEYFRRKKLEKADQGPFFGFVAKNEISNGRWAMFGFAVGLLTEYATGSDLVDQVKVLLSNFGILDLD